MIIINLSILVLFVTSIALSVWNTNTIKALGVEKTGAVMLSDQKARIQLAVQSAALMAAVAIEAVDTAAVKDTLRRLVDKIIYEEDGSGYFFIYEGTVSVAFPVAKAKVGKDLGSITDKNGIKVIQELHDKARAGGGFVEYIWSKPGAGDQPKLSYATMIPGTQMWIGTGVYLDNIATHQDKMASEMGSLISKRTTTMIIITGLIFAAIIALCLVIARGIVKALKEMVDNFQDIAEGEGDLTKRIAIDSKDEIADLAVWFNTFLEKLQGTIQQLTGGVDTLSSSATELSAISEQMRQGIQASTDKSTTVAAATEELSSNMASVAGAMEESTTNTNMVATASEEMSATIDEIAQNAEKARGISEEAAHKSAEANTNMDQLGTAADAIGKVVETITEISEQVNLLALNATIEAARAGEAGKGFAVVANEIKELAKQTANASQDIKAKIGAIQGTTESTVGQITEITTVITAVNELVTTIASAVEQQSAATKEIADNVAQASLGIQEVNDNVNQSAAVSTEISSDIAGVSTSMEEMSTSSEQVNLSAVELSNLSENLKQLVDQFKI
jgi:methyl-accepting chemotaxis protein